MSVAPAIETYTCPVEGCEFTFAGEPDAVTYARREHELVHDVDEEVGAFRAEKAEENKPERHIGSPAPVSGKTVEQLDAEYREAQLGQVVTVRCADCLFEETGPQSEARRAWARHRRDEHHDDQVDAVERSLAGIRIRRTSTGRRAISQNVNKLDEHVRATRLQGGGHAVETQTNGSKVRTGSQPWSRKEAIAAIQAFTAEHGRAPTSSEWTSSTGLPSYVTARKLFGTTQDAIAAADGLAVPPPATNAERIREGHSEGQTEPPIAPEPAPVQASAEGTSEVTLVALARAVEELTEKRRAMLAELDAIEAELRQAVSACESALRACALEEAA